MMTLFAREALLGALLWSSLVGFLLIAAFAIGYLVGQRHPTPLAGHVLDELQRAHKIGAGWIAVHWPED